MDWKENINLFIKEYGEVFSSCLLVGSGVYSKKLRSDSDIDLIVIMKSLDEWKFACKMFFQGDFESFFEETKSFYKQKRCDYFCIKFVYNGREYSIDFILESMISNLIGIFNEDLSLNHYELYKATNLPQSNPYSFKWKNVTFKQNKVNTLINNSYVINCPIYVKKDHYVFYGILLNKLYTGYEFIWGSKNIDKLIKLLVSKSMKCINKLNKSKDVTDLISSLTRYPRFKKIYIRELYTFLSELDG